jgi:glycerol-3-phosphate dehydrogenase
VAGVKISEEELHGMLSEVDINKNGQVELEEYLELMNSLKTGIIANSRLAIAIQQEHASGEEREYKKITVERSGGGL